MKKTLPIYAVLAMLLGYVLWLWWSASSAENRAGGGRGAVPVAVQQISQRTMGDVITALGTAQSREGVVITSQQTGLIKQLHFRDGQMVRADDLLVTLHDDEERAKLREAEAKLADNRSQLERLQNLTSGSAVSKSMLEEKAYAVQVAEAQLQVARAALDKRYIRAPFSGVLGARQVSPGALVTVGTPITTLDNLSTVKVEFTVPEMQAGNIEPGLTLAATSAAYPGEKFKGKLTHVDTRINPATRTLNLLAEIDNSERRLKPGMLIDIRITQDKSEVLAVPEGALISLARQHYVFVVGEDNIARQKQIVIGKRRIGYAEVLEGLQLGETVIVEGTHKVRDGQPVQIQPAAAAL